MNCKLLDKKNSEVLFTEVACVTKINIYRMFVSAQCLVISQTIIIIWPAGAVA